MIKIAICDDEKYFVDTVEKMLKIYAEKNGKDFCIKKYTKPLQLMESLKEEFQIFFLDIEMHNPRFLSWYEMRIYEFYQYRED